jgi:MFS family permease
VAWLRWFRDQPADHPGVNAAELSHINQGVVAESPGRASTPGGASMFALAASWASCMEIGTAQSGLASATMNTIGQVGAMLSPIVLAWLVERSGAAGRWELPLQVIASLYFVSALCWIFINARGCSST